MLAAALALLLAGAGAGAQQPAAEVEALVAAAVRTRMGSGAVVTISALRSQSPQGTTATAAVPAGSLTIGRPARFTLLAGGAPAGYAIATVAVSVPHLRAARAIAAGAEIAADDLQPADGSPGQVTLSPLPGAAELEGARAVRAIAAGEVLTARMVKRAPMVRSGALVSVRTVMGHVEATGTAVAQQSGDAGDVIRLVNPDSRRALRGRIIGRNEVEIVHGSQN